MSYKLKTQLRYREEWEEEQGVIFALDFAEFKTAGDREVSSPEFQLTELLWLTTSSRLRSVHKRERDKRENNCLPFVLDVCWFLCTEIEREGLAVVLNPIAVSPTAANQ